MRGSPEDNRAFKRQRYDPTYSCQQQPQTQPPQQQQQNLSNPYQQQQRSSTQNLYSYDSPPTNVTNNFLPNSNSINPTTSTSPQNQQQHIPSNSNPLSTSVQPLPNSAHHSNSNSSFGHQLLPSFSAVGIDQTLNTSQNQIQTNWNDDPLSTTFRPNQTLPSLQSDPLDTDNTHFLPPQSSTLSALNDGSQNMPPLLSIPPHSQSSIPHLPLPFLLPNVMHQNPPSRPPVPQRPNSSPYPTNRNTANLPTPQINHNTNNSNLSNPNQRTTPTHSKPSSRYRQPVPSRTPRMRAPIIHQRNNSNINSNTSNPFSKERNSPNSFQRDSSVTLGQINPIKNALAEIPDDNAIMKALTQCFLQKSNINFSIKLRREKVLAFRGFPKRGDPKSSYLSHLAKTDLDVVAWIFNVPCYGKKEEIAKRIVRSLFSPLTYRSTSTSRKPKFPRNDRQISSSAFHHSTGTIATNRGSMPPLMDQSSILNPNRTTLLHSLQRQISVSKPVTSNRSLARAVPASRPGAHMNRSKQTIDLFLARLSGYNFMDEENPFNIPANSPLGYPMFTAFSAVDLSRGEANPVLRFVTPPPIDPAKKPEIRGGDIQIHLRCLQMDEKKDKSQWKQAWPFPAACRVNSHGVTLNQAQRYTNGKLAGRDAATDITPFLRKYRAKGRAEENRVTLRRQESNANPASGYFVLFAQEVLVLSHETVTKSIVSESVKHWETHRDSLQRKGTISATTTNFEMAQQGVMQFLSAQEDIQVEAMKVSLRCPLALTRIKAPVKGKRCQHIQCFDLDNFLQFARRSSKFDCPVCNKPTAYPSMLVISPYIEKALENFPDCDEIEIFQDGSMKEVEKKQNGVASDGEDEDNTGQKSHATLSHLANKTGPTEVVDLTLDSEDDNAVAPPEHQSTPFPGRRRRLSFGTGRQSHVDNEIMLQGRLENINEEEGDVDQDEDFPFRADFTWRDELNAGGNETGRGPQNVGSNQANNWTCDVIALDSD